MTSASEIPHLPVEPGRHGDTDLSIELATPWRRYWARSLDITIFSILIGIAIGMIMPSLFAADGPFSKPGSEQLLGWAILPVAMIAEGLVLGLFGTTPGKAIAGVRVAGISGAKLTVGDAIQRNFQLWWYGLGTGIPIIALFTLIASYRKAARGEPMRWEASTGARSYGKSHAGRTLMTAFLCLGLYVALFTIDDQDQGFGQGSFGSPADRYAGWVESELQIAADEINQEAPTLVDEYTRLDGAEAGPGKVLTYRYTMIDTDIEQIDSADLQEFESTMAEVLRTSNCDDPATRQLFDADVQLVYEYADSNGNFVSRFAVMGKDCVP